MEAEDNFNCQLENVTVTARDGRISTLETVCSCLVNTRVSHALCCVVHDILDLQAYIRGSHIRFLIVPDMLKNAPFFRMQEAPKGMGRGRAVALKRGM